MVDISYLSAAFFYQDTLTYCAICLRGSWRGISADPWHHAAFELIEYWRPLAPGLFKPMAEIYAKVGSIGSPDRFKSRARSSRGMIPWAFFTDVLLAFVPSIDAARVHGGWTTFIVFWICLAI